jgi:hypothetical protein
VPVGQPEVRLCRYWASNDAEQLRGKLLNSTEAKRILRDLRALKRVAHGSGFNAGCYPPPGLDATYAHLRYPNGRTLTVGAIVFCEGGPLDVTNGAISRTGTNYQIERLQHDLQHLTTSR